MAVAGLFGGGCASMWFRIFWIIAWNNFPRRFHIRGFRPNSTNPVGGFSRAYPAATEIGDVVVRGQSGSGFLLDKVNVEIRRKVKRIGVW